MEKALCAGECPCGAQPTPFVSVCACVWKESDCRGEKMQSAHAILMWFVVWCDRRSGRSHTDLCVHSGTFATSRRTPATREVPFWIHLHVICAWWSYDNIIIQMCDVCASNIRLTGHTCKCLCRNICDLSHIIRVCVCVCGVRVWFEHLVKICSGKAFHSTVCTVKPVLSGKRCSTERFLDSVEMGIFERGQQ